MTDLALSVIVAFSAGTVITLLLMAREKKKFFPWTTFAVMFVIIAVIAGMLMARAIEMTNIESFEFYILIPITWIIAIMLLARANREEVMEKQYDGISALNEIARSYMSDDDLSHAAKTSLTSVAESFNADGGLIFNINRRQKNIELLVSFGEIPKHALDLIKIITTRTMKDGKTIHRIVDLDEDLRKLHNDYVEAAKREGFKSIFAFPITYSENFYGMLLLFSRKKLTLSPQDKDILNLIVFELGMWLESARHIRKMRRMSKIQKGILDSSLALLGDLSSEEIIRSIIQQLDSIIPTRDFGVYLYNPVRDTMKPAYATGEYEKEILAEEEYLLSEAGIGREVLINKRPEIVNDVTKDSRWSGFDTDIPDDNLAVLFLPLISKGGEPIGVIELHRRAPRIFTNEDLEAGLLFAQHASLALENARMLQSMENEKEMAQLYLDILSHDIANLSTPLCSYFEIMLHHGDLDEETREILKKGSDMVEKISSLLSRVRKLSSSPLDEPEELKPIDLNLMLQNTIQSIKKSFPHRKLEIAMDKITPGCGVMAGEMLEEILLNLMHNAVKSTSGEEVNIEISLKKVENIGSWHCILEVADHGKGVPDEDKERIFLGAPTLASSFARGFGIGLSNCRKLVEKYGGAIWVEDRVEGDHAQGARFVISLPLYIGT